MTLGPLLLQVASATIVICDYAFIGTSAIFMPCITIGEFSVVDAGPVVTKPVQPGDTVSGIRARVIANGRNRMTYKNDYKRIFH
jgi:acetyltransferase-like isoleucine patch superfamily enzyme